jgi:sugar phosphate permease
VHLDYGAPVKIRWWICLLLFLSWVISYVDRSLMPMAMPLIAQEFHMSPTMMGGVMSAFFLGYASMQIPGGIIADRIGGRRAITLGITTWSALSLLTGTVASLKTLLAVRIFFGLGEGIHPPATFKVLSAWFDTAEKARANGFMMSSNTIGPMITPLIFAPAMVAFGWRNAFYLISIPGFLVSILVYRYLRDTPSDYPGITPAEQAESGSAKLGEKRVPVAQLLKYKILWQLFLIYLTWDVTWWGFQAWLPSYLIKERGFKLINSGLVTSLPFVAGFLGVLFCAFISDRTGKRKSVLIFALCGNAIFMLLTATAPNGRLAVVFLTLTGFFLPAIQGPFWSLAMEALPSDVMGYSSGFINTGGQIAGVVSPLSIGALIQFTHTYDAGFIFMAISAGLSALLVALLKSPKSHLRVPFATELAK